jgi:hypothetical protein
MAQTPGCGRGEPRRRLMTPLMAQLQGCKAKLTRRPRLQGPDRWPRVAGVLICFWAASSTAAPLEAVYTEAAAGVVLVLAGPRPGHRGPPGASQAGFVVSPEGKVLTGAAGIFGPNGHDPWDTIFVYVKPPQLQAQAEGNLVNRYRAQVIASAPVDGVNLALLQLEDAPARRQ